MVGWMGGWVDGWSEGVSRPFCLLRQQPHTTKQQPCRALQHPPSTHPTRHQQQSAPQHGPMPIRDGVVVQPLHLAQRGGDALRIGLHQAVVVEPVFFGGEGGCVMTMMGGFRGVSKGRGGLASAAAVGWVERAEVSGRLGNRERVNWLEYRSTIQPPL